MLLHFSDLDCGSDTGLWIGHEAIVTHCTVLCASVRLLFAAGRVCVL